MSLWLKPNRNDLEIQDLITYRDADKKIGTSVTYTDVVYNQHYNQLCRYPELFFIFKEHCLNAFNWNSFHNTIRVELDYRSKLTVDDILPSLLDCFRENKNIAIKCEFSTIELVNRSYYSNQTFEDYRVKCIAEIHKKLGLSLVGYGKYLVNYKFQDGTYARHITNPPKFDNMTKEQLKLFYEILDTKDNWTREELKILTLEIASNIRTSVEP